MIARSIAARERAALCDLFDELGPDAPTLCEGWTTLDLAAHLWMRERRPHAAAGLIVPPLAGLAERTTEQAKARGYDSLVAAIRKGPPVSVGRADDVIHLHEFFVHHEDVRRTLEGWARRDDTALDEALWRRLRLWGRILTRRLGTTGVVLAHGARTMRVRKGETAAVVRGTPQELFLYLFGRRDVAAVELDGPPEAQAALAGADLNF